MLPLGATQQILQSHNKPDFSTFQNQFNSYLNLLFQYPLTQISKDERTCIFVFCDLGPHAFTFYFTFRPHAFTFYFKFLPRTFIFYLWFSLNTFTFYFIILFNFFFKLGTITFNFHFSFKFQGLLNLKSGFRTYGLTFSWGWMGIPFWPRCNIHKVHIGLKAHTVQILQNANLKTTKEQYS